MSCIKDIELKAIAEGTIIDFRKMMSGSSSDKLCWVKEDCSIRYIGEAKPFSESNKSPTRTWSIITQADFVTFHTQQPFFLQDIFDSMVVLSCYINHETIYHVVHLDDFVRKFTNNIYYNINKK